MTDDLSLDLHWQHLLAELAYYGEHELDQHEHWHLSLAGGPVYVSLGREPAGPVEAYVAVWPAPGERCSRLDVRGHQCALVAGHTGDHQRTAVVTWPEYVVPPAPHPAMGECAECGDRRSVSQMSVIDPGVMVGLCCCDPRHEHTAQDRIDRRWRGPR